MTWVTQPDLRLLLIFAADSSRSYKRVDALWEKTCAPVLLYSKRGFCNQADLSLQTLPKSSLGKQCLSEDRSCDNPCIHDTAPYTDNKCKTDSVFEEQLSDIFQTKLTVQARFNTR
ncbi:unnamed protein product [Albugo candida]|uniref:Uncharacterized protein n=1 Tax=Albugo candida TaxID=65357 RepID=A0A024FYC6_9STRA|nr:unnamed protein product [Albugo candida]|eukprot:CCI11674.1 unnamed protein product [Albugo candida]